MTPAIKTERLTKTYGTARALVDLDITVETGEVFGYLGPNGAGKSTTIRLLLDLQRVTSGSAQVLGRDSHNDSLEIHRRVGYLPGELALFPRMTGQQHIDWFAKARGRADGELTRQLTDRFGVELNRPVRQLSKGNRQKIGIVIAFMSHPELLILDEPTSGLDPLMQAEFEKLVRETAADGRTVFLSSHELAEVQRLADRIAIIKQGRLVVSDSVEHLRAKTPHRVEIHFGETADRTWFDDCHGVAVVGCENDRVQLRLTGALEPLLRVVVEHHPVELVSQQADLEELFLEFYRDQNTDEARP